MIYFHMLYFNEHMWNLHYKDKPVVDNVAVGSDNNMRHANTMCGQTEGGTCIYRCILKPHHFK
jgi:hypothetical protein